MIMSDSEAEQIYNALKEIGQKIELLEKKDILSLTNNEVKELSNFVVFMDDLFQS